MHFDYLPPAQVVIILTEEGNYISSEVTIYWIMREEGLLNHRDRAWQIR
jgi:putative transposase